MRVEFEWWLGRTWCAPRVKRRLWEHLLVIQLILDPSHASAEVFRRRKHHGLMCAISPSKFVPDARTHFWEGLLRTLIGDETVKPIDFIEEVHNLDSKPFILAFSRGSLIAS